MHPHRAIPVIDLFAGPGGLGEGFAAFTTPAGRRPFRIALSIEKEETAHQTLQLRAFFRQFDPGAVPVDYYAHLRGELTRDELASRHKPFWDTAVQEAWKQELAPEHAVEVRRRIQGVLDRESTDAWVLIGGPPCQAYSLVGRSRNAGIRGYSFEKDARSRLYIEYLQIIADHAPTVFVMENVKGLLSATLESDRLFERILEDLEDPAAAMKREGRPVLGVDPRYELRALRVSDAPNQEELFTQGHQRERPSDFVLCAERHGVPQKRHRVIVVGVRRDVSGVLQPLMGREKVATEAALAGLPRLRSGLSSDDSRQAWVEAIQEIRKSDWLKELRTLDSDVAHRVQDAVADVKAPRADRGEQFVVARANCRYEPAWMTDARLGGVCNHHTRGHIREDLHRYMYAACFAAVHAKSPDLSDFPHHLLPDHRNVRAARNRGHFSDRFRVQLRREPASTVTAHISKDGHYYIHYDASQCRSLTVREAARLQSFPDNYFFCGGRTAQYVQVGNAVPPLLARDIARAVAGLLGEDAAGATTSRLGRRHGSPVGV